MKQQRNASGRKGPNIVAIGGGTGLSTLLRGLKDCTDRLTAIVTMADDGGGSGQLRADLGMPPPGDVRHCLQALANVEPLMEELINYRFPEGTLKGQSFGNLFLAALMGVTGSFEDAVSSMSKVLAITGRVLPVTCDDIHLVAKFENGTQVMGESKISAFKKAQDCRISHVRLEPKNPTVNKDAVEAIGAADLILLGPGSLYTSVIPNLLVDGIVDAIADAHALRVYVCNVMTQDGETEDYTVSDHLKALMSHSGGRKLVDYCLVNSDPVPSYLLPIYSLQNAAPIRLDREAVEALGVEVVEQPMVDPNHTCLARHDPERLAKAIMKLMEDHSVRVVEQGTARYLRER